MALDPLTAGIEGGTALIGLAQTLIGAGQAKRANKELSRLFKQRKAFQTPQEIFDILQMNQYASQTGYSADTLQFLESNVDRNLSSALGTAQRLGADPNVTSGILDSSFQDIFKIGGESELLKMKKFDSLTNALQLLASNRGAEQISADNLIKDQMQAAAARVAKGEQNIQSGIGLGLNSLTALATNSLYNPDGTPKRKKPTASSGGIYSSSGGYIGE